MIRQSKFAPGLVQFYQSYQYGAKALVSGAPKFNFSLAKVHNQYAQFQERYMENAEAFREKMQQLENPENVPLKKPMTKGYTHPFNSDHHPLNFSAVKVAELFHDFVGPEQVSPHYENYLMSRKYLMGFFGMFFTLTFGAGSFDLHYIAVSMINPLIFWGVLMYFYVELRKSWFKPLLQRFYRRVSANDMYNMEVYYHENMEHRVRNMIRLTKDQMQYFEIHRQFQDIKAESVNLFMANEYANLQKHINDRATNLLKQAHSYENLNQTRIVQEIITNASTELDRQLDGPERDQIQEQMFESALIGLAEGRMEYKNDPILPIVQNYIRQNSEKYTNLSAQEQRDLVTLSQHQLEALRNIDEQAKQEYLTSEPKGFDSSLKNHDTVKKILSHWGH